MFELYCPEFMSYVVLLNILFKFCNDDVCMKKVIIRLRAFDLEKLHPRKFSPEIVLCSIKFCRFLLQLVDFKCL